MTRRILYLPALIVGAVLLACAVVLLVVSERAEATFPGKNGRIAYASYDAPFPKGDSEIYTIRADGSGKRQLTNNDREDIDPAYSPDGKKIVYASADKPKGNYELYTINARGGNRVRVTNNDVDEAWPTYSPSGKRIAFTDMTVNEPGPHIYQIEAGGDGMTLLARNGGVPSYSPDGERIAYECLGRGPSIDTDICTISVRREHKLAELIPEKPAESTLHDVLHDKVHVTSNDTDDFNPDYSPDGERIVYQGFEGRIHLQKDEDASANIYTIKADGGDNLNLTKSPKNDALWNDWPSYSPDGKEIAYMGADGEIHTMGARGGGKSRLTNNDAYPQKLSWGSRP